MAASLQLKIAIWFYILTSWTVVVYAAEQDKFSTGIEAIPFESFKYVLIIVAISGTAATLTKLTKTHDPNLPPPPPIKNLPLEIVKDAVTSFAAGVFAFLVTSWWEGVDFWMQAIIIFIAGYGGSRALESVFNEGFMPWMRGVFDRILNRHPTSATPAPPSQDPPSP